MGQGQTNPFAAVRSDKLVIFAQGKFYKNG